MVYNKSPVNPYLVDPSRGDCSADAKDLISQGDSFVIEALCRSKTRSGKYLLATAAVILILILTSPYFVYSLGLIAAVTFILLFPVLVFALLFLTLAGVSGIASMRTAKFRILVDEIGIAIRVNGSADQLQRLSYDQIIAIENDGNLTTVYLKDTKQVNAGLLDKIRLSEVDEKRLKLFARKHWRGVTVID